MEEYSNPYWDEIKERIDEVTDGMNISMGLPPRRVMYAQLHVATAIDLLASTPYQEFDPALFADRYDHSLYRQRKVFCKKYCWLFLILIRLISS